MASGSPSCWPESRKFRTLTAENYGGDHTLEFVNAVKEQAKDYHRLVMEGMTTYSASQASWRNQLGKAQLWAEEHNRERANLEDLFDPDKIDTDKIDIVEVAKWVFAAMGCRGKVKNFPTPEHRTFYDYASDPDTKKDAIGWMLKLIPKMTNPDGQSSEESEEEAGLESLLGGGK